VLEHGWAYGSTGHVLRGKQWLSVISTGERADAYRHAGYNRFTLRELLAPLEQTASLCGMTFLPPLAYHGTHRMSDADIAQAAGHYRAVLTALRDDRLDLAELAPHATLHDALATLPDALE
jgi:glutathione-regulated potassium-efflux system ancillary protein KefG